MDCGAVFFNSIGWFFHHCTIFFLNFRSFFRVFETFCFVQIYSAAIFLEKCTKLQFDLQDEQPRQQQLLNVN